MLLDTPRITRHEATESCQRTSLTDTTITSTFLLGHRVMAGTGLHYNVTVTLCTFVLELLTGNT